MKSVGYQWLIERFNLNVCDLLTKSYCISESRMREVEEDGKLATAKRKFFPELSEDEIQRLEEIVNA